MKRIFIAVSLIALLAGCASGPRITPGEQADILSPLQCSQKAECDFFWSRIQAWIANNSSFRIQTATPVLIATYGPSMQPNSTYVAYKAVREDNRDGSASIRISASCMNVFTCETDPLVAIRNLKTYVRGGK